MSKWFKAAGIRSTKTMAQTAVAMVGTAFKSLTRQMNGVIRLLLNQLDEVN